MTQSTPGCRGRVDHNGWLACKTCLSRSRQNALLRHTTITSHRAAAVRYRSPHTHTDRPLARTGSTHTITPADFVDDLKVLELGGVGSRALPNGLSETSAPMRSAQEVYDQKYFTRDAPPPPRAAPAPSPAPGSGRRGGTGVPAPPPLTAGANVSSGSNYSNSGTYTEEKKKKRGFLRF